MENISDYDFEVSMAEDRVEIASMPLADYQAWLFPPKDKDGHDEGVNTLEMLWATLKAAGYDEDLAKVKIAATLWSRRHYEGETPMAARHIVQRVPASKIVEYLPPSTQDVKALESLSPRSHTNGGRKAFRNELAAPCRSIRYRPNDSHNSNKEK